MCHADWNFDQPFNVEDARVCVLCGQRYDESGQPVQELTGTIVHKSCHDHVMNDPDI